MIRRATTLAALLVLLAPSLPAGASPPRLTPAEVAAWREDLRVLDREMKRLHPLLFARLTPTRLTEARFDSAVAALDARIPALARHEVIVGMMGLVALAGAGHTAISPQFDSAPGFRSYPIELAAMSDGMFVVRADPAWRQLAGARVVRLGAVPVDDALARVGTVLAHENEPFLRTHGPGFLMIPEVLGALGIAPDMERLALTVEQDGKERTVTLAPGGPLPLRPHAGGVAPERADWVSMRPATVAPPLWESRSERRWLTFLPDSRTLYVACQSSVPPHGHDEPIDAFFARVLAAVDSLAPERLVLDVRDNLGGNQFFNRDLLLGVVRRPAIDRRGKLFVVIGGGTYSAAQNLVNEFERYTNVTFVGEPTGAPPAFFGDHREVMLPKSGIRVMVSSLWWQPPQNPADRRPFTAPAIFAAPTSADHRTGRDPVLAAILRHGDRPSLEARLEEALATGDTARAARILGEEKADPVNRYANLEARVNTLGYRWMGGGELARAAQVLAVNAREFATSANAQDSVGEAYERLGRRDDAIAAYRRALALAPGMASASDGLTRLGAAP